MSAAEIGTWVSVGVGVIGFGLTIALLWRTRADVQRALGRFRRVAAVADVGTAIRTVDEIEELLRRESYDGARMRMGDLRILLPQIRDNAPDADTRRIQPLATYVRLLHDDLGDVVGGDESKYAAADFRRHLSVVRAAMEDLQAQSRAAAGGQ